MNRLFTLIELIVVIAVLGILAAIIIPNISSFQEEANDTAILSNVRNLQTSVDMYGLDNFGSVPTADIPLEDVPQPIDFNKVYPEYTRDLPETEGVKYWVDFQGKVWASTIDSPSDVTYNPGTLEWTGVENAAYYNIFKVVDNNASSSIKNKKTIFIKKLEDSSPNVLDNSLPNLKTGEQYLVSAVDKQGFESAPAGTNYNGYVEVPFTGGQSSPEGQDAFVPVSSGTSYVFTNAGATGRFGPTQNQLDSAYSNSTLEGKVTSNNGIQLWTVPATGKYRIETLGAGGGTGGGTEGGYGAKMSGDFNLTQGDKLFILVGQRGTDSIVDSNQNGGSGGGGTFVAKGTILSDTEPLIVAGGGAGSTNLARTSSYCGTTTSGSGYCHIGKYSLDANTTENSNNGYNLNTYAINGQGGKEYGGGGGFYSNGGSGVSGYDPDAFGYGFRQGGEGGLGTRTTPIEGGFGGGAAGHNGPEEAGAGGGYSGGGGSNNSGTGGGIRGGGGSYNAGSNQSNSEQANRSHGKVTITFIN